MKIEPGKYYRMRNGEKAYVVAAIPREVKVVYEWIGVKIENGPALTWMADGGFFQSGEQKFHDLVAPWDEPAPREIIIDGNRFKLTRIEG